MKTHFLRSLSVLLLALPGLEAQGAFSGAVCPGDGRTAPGLERRVRQLAQQLGALGAEGLHPVRVNGEVLSPLHVCQALVHLVGSEQVRQHIDDAIVEEWKAQAIQGGRDPAEFAVDEDRIAAKLGNKLQEFQKNNPGVPFWDAVRATTGMDRDAYLHHYRQTELFDRVFFPGPATNWPEITREAIIADAAAGQGPQFWENLESGSVDESGRPRALPPVWMKLCRRSVSKQLVKWCEIRYPADGLPPATALVVNGVEWQTAAAFEQVRPGLFQQDIERALTAVIVREALRQELVEAGAYSSDEEFRREFDEYRQQDNDTPFTAGGIAFDAEGYPGLEAFRQRWRLMRSYERMIAEEIHDENLKAYAEEYRSLFGEGAVSVDAIRFSARDLETRAWLPDGMAGARQRAEAAVAAIQDGASFEDVRRERGEFCATDQSQGRFHAAAYSLVRRLMRETEFTDLLIGASVARYAFCEAPVGEVVGPLAGPDAWWILRVNGRAPLGAAPVVTDARTHEAVRQDYIAYRFLQWANGVMARIEIE